MLFISKNAAPVTQSYHGGLTEMQDVAEVFCDNCNASLGNGDETVYQIGNTILCCDCFKQQALEILGAKETTAGEFAESERR